MHSIFRTDFPFETNFEKYHFDIKNEFASYTDSDLIHGTLKNYTKSGEWNTIILSYNNEFYPDALKYFPKTTEMLSGFGRVFHSQISILKPNTFFVPHRGEPRDGILRGHHVITSPSDAICKLKAIDDEIDQIEGTSFYFDDTEIHWGGNPSKTSDRAVLIFDFWPLDIEPKTYTEFLYNRDIPIVND